MEFMTQTSPRSTGKYRQQKIIEQVTGRLVAIIGINTTNTHTFCTPEPNATFTLDEMATILSIFRDFCVSAIMSEP